MPLDYVLTFEVLGDPVAKGSMTPGVTSDGRPYVRDQKSKRLKEWQAEIAKHARLFVVGKPPMTGPIKVDLTFLMPRPKNHIRANGMLKDWAPVWHTSKPDEDKLRRAVLDALTQARVYVDDGQVCDGSTRKVYAAPGKPSGVRITVGLLAEAAA